MPSFQPPPKDPHIQDELVRLIEKIPEIVTVGVCTDDGMNLGFASKSDSIDERRTEAQFLAALDTAERGVDDLGLGLWAYYVTSNAQGMGLCLLLGDEHLLYLIAPADVSPDDMLSALKPYCETLLELIKQLPPKPPPVQQPSDPAAQHWLESLAKQLDGKKIENKSDIRPETPEE